jgi:hypothetical protein
MFIKGIGFEGNISLDGTSSDCNVSPRGGFQEKYVLRNHAYILEENLRHVVGVIDSRNRACDGVVLWQNST